MICGEFCFEDDGGVCGDGGSIGGCGGGGGPLPDPPPTPSPVFLPIKKIKIKIKYASKTEKKNGGPPKLYRSSYPHRARELVSPVCGIFFLSL